MNKNLVLLNDDYPTSSGEFFIDDEMKVLEKYFKNIYIIKRNQSGLRLNRYVPNKLEIKIYKDHFNVYEKIKSIRHIFSKLFIEELKAIKNTYKIKISYLIIKIILNDIIKSSKLKKEINTLIKEKNLNLNETVFYSYWHDYKALTLARIKYKFPEFKCISRAHRWDIYFYANSPEYLPFKYFILENLNKSISISEDGISYWKNKFPKLENNKLMLSKLGKFNNRNPFIKKVDNSVFRICSCSTLKEVKRVHLIIETLSIIKNLNLEWIHFGDGELRKDLEELAKNKLANVNYNFTGNISNEKILNFYSENYVDLFLNVSSSEGIPVSIMESLSAGIPVIATNVGGNNEIINNKNGSIIDSDFRTEELSTKIYNYSKLKETKIIQYRENAYKFWLENYNAKKNYANFTSYMKNLK
ncbi:MAG: hypothetical protein CL846_04960 [Crocinitomicaceae bacterium]|nr:hypothetical protein [Crocinitomicaceae bacterium]|tara:strand:+ start:3594 stop:4838 length:1245 start_codon:yes stop_codon:yes gene_type:complete